ncbi:MAG: hypothetical protein ACRBM6_27930 [Geminicoccales bacterium]
MTFLSVGGVAVPIAIYAMARLPGFLAYLTFAIIGVVQVKSTVD